MRAGRVQRRSRINDFASGQRPDYREFTATAFLDRLSIQQLTSERRRRVKRESSGPYEYHEQHTRHLL